MLTVGVDLASQDVNTAICSIRWRVGAARVESFVCPADDTAILAACRGADACGIDAPFGWPVAFVAQLSATSGARVDWTPDRQKALRLRATDIAAHERVKRQPLSVSSDRIALAALRAQGLLADFGVSDRSGAPGRVFEVWPSGLRRVMGWQANKAAVATDPKAELARLRAAMPWLEMDAAFERGSCARSSGDHVLDALVAAVAARAAKIGLTDLPLPKHAEIAAREGWIHLPSKGVTADQFVTE